MWGRDWLEAWSSPLRTLGADCCRAPSPTLKPHRRGELGGAQEPPEEGPLSGEYPSHPALFTSSPRLFLQLLTSGLGTVPVLTHFRKSKIGGVEE